MIYEKVGKRIKEERIRQGLTQSGLAELIEVDVSYIGRIERAQSKMSLETFVKITNALDVTADQLLVDVVDEATSKQIKTQIEFLLSLEDTKKKEVAELLECITNFVK